MQAMNRLDIRRSHAPVTDEFLARRAPNRTKGFVWVMRPDQVESLRKSRLPAGANERHVIPTEAVGIPIDAEA